MRVPLLVAIVLSLVGAHNASAEVVITVDKSSQHLSVLLDGKLLYAWPVSTARWGYHTPNGSYTPERLEVKWYSHKYDMSPMPHSIFFNGGHAEKKSEGYLDAGAAEISHIARFLRECAGTKSPSDPWTLSSDRPRV